MAKLDYRANNPRWGYRGLVFENWENFSLTLGFLSNRIHYVGQNGGTKLSNSIQILIEQNNQQGAWGREGRILYYNSINLLHQYLPDLNNANTRGVGRVTSRINSSEYIRDLLSDFSFQLIGPMRNRTTMLVIPPDNAFDTVYNSLNRILISNNISQQTISICTTMFANGWNL